MLYKIIWKLKALKQASDLPGKERKRISEAVESLADKSKWRNVKPLVNHVYDFRLRVGNYRVLFNCEKELKILKI